MTALNRGAGLSQDELEMSKFKIAQALVYRRGNVKQGGRYIVLAVLPQSIGKTRYRIRSQDDDRRNGNAWLVAADPETMRTLMAACPLLGEGVAATDVYLGRPAANLIAEAVNRCAV
jgi:hypothetical protein